MSDQNICIKICLEIRTRIDIYHQCCMHPIIHLLIKLVFESINTKGKMNKENERHQVIPKEEMNQNINCMN